MLLASSAAAKHRCSPDNLGYGSGLLAELAKNRTPCLSFPTEALSAGLEQQNLILQTVLNMKSN
jgi:hypothetical protein